MDTGDFAEVLSDRAEELARLSYTQKVPGLEREDVHQELVATLWKAWTTYTPESGTTLGQWWWVVWIRRKADLIEAFFARKNRFTTAPFTDDHLESLAVQIGDSMEPLVSVSDLCPSDEPTAVALWVLLAAGFTNVEIRNLLGISVRRFYSIVDTWRTAEVRAALSCT